MREINFRAWDKENEIMICPKGILFDGRVVNFSCGMLEAFEGYEIMQYTGLKDKNGREIYEGDIVKSATQNDIIKFEYGSFMVMGLHEDKYEREYSMLYHFLVDATTPNEKHSKFDGVTTTLEVIGNIYENPELLECEEC